MAEKHMTFGLVNLLRPPTQAEIDAGVHNDPETLVLDTQSSLVPGGLIYLNSKGDADRLVAQLRRVGVSARSLEMNTLSYAEWLELYNDRLLELAIAKGHAQATAQAK